MRLSTSQIYDSGTNGLLRNQFDLFRLQNQMSTGRRVVTPADDPVASAQALIVAQKQNVNSQFVSNQASAKNQLAELETQMGAVGTLLTEIKSRWVEAGNGAYGANELRAISADLRGKMQQLLGIANSADANGLYRFAGYQAATQPFVASGGVISYQGDDGVRQLQVEASRFMPTSFSGRELFEGVPQGNGTFVVGADAGNTGTGIISNGSTVGTYDGNTYVIEFDSLLSFTVNGGPSIPYTEYGQVIDVGGAQISLKGNPDVGDTFTVGPSGTESMFTTLNNFINALEAPQTTAVEKALFQNTMARVGASLDQGLQHVLDGRALVGAQMAELESLTAVGEDLDIQYESQISELVDLDYTKAITDLSKNQLQLQAAQQSFLKVTSLSLFNFL